MNLIGVVHDFKKRFAEESDEFEEFGAKRAKIRDLEFVFRSEGKIKHNIASAIDINAKDDGPSCVDDTTLSQSKMNCVKSRGFAFDLNIEDDQDQVKPRDSLSECGSTCHLGGERDSVRVWNEMKRNGFLIVWKLIFIVLCSALPFFFVPDSIFSLTMLFFVIF
ncbi:uncharacterized protein LOC110892595 [Helianthus annuus]|uniref:uncharacterized protein LOC110892595 n=1 Tax=Helianthus annuus TaxID=4232 RepID=UPI0016531778|nr:uncharacterized protein LOC110892595 [Helianthus annuus]